jgi:hypothetical protein
MRNSGNHATWTSHWPSWTRRRRGFGAFPAHDVDHGLRGRHDVHGAARSAGHCTDHGAGAVADLADTARPAARHAHVRGADLPSAGGRDLGAAAAGRDADLEGQGHQRRRVGAEIDEAAVAHRSRDRAGGAVDAGTDRVRAGVAGAVALAEGLCAAARVRTAGRLGATAEGDARDEPCADTRKALEPVGKVAQQDAAPGLEEERAGSAPDAARDLGVYAA